MKHTFFAAVAVCLFGSFAMAQTSGTLEIPDQFVCDQVAAVSGRFANDVV